MEIICINGSFSADYLEFYKKHGIVTPKKGSLYGIREVVKNMGKTDSSDNIGFLLDELVNPKVEQLHSVLGPSGVKIEPNWSIKRFSNLDGSEITSEQLRAEDQMIKVNKIFETKLTYNGERGEGKV